MPKEYFAYPRAPIGPVMLAPHPAGFILFATNPLDSPLRAHELCRRTASPTVHAYDKLPSKKVDSF